MSQDVIFSKVVKAANMMGTSKVVAGRQMNSSSDLMRFAAGLLKATAGLTKKERTALLARFGV